MMSPSPPSHLVIINPGSGPVPRARFASANANMRTFLRDVNLKGAQAEAVLPKVRDGGRFSFLIFYQKREVSVLMPGLPLARVRWMGSDQDIWNFPRLYVDGSSWVWKFAVNSAHNALLGVR
jgi:hypothetical protein